MPTTEEYGGPPEWGPESFIQTGEYGVLGSFGFDGERLVLVYRSASLEAVVDALGEARGDSLTKDQMMADTDASWGNVVFEPQDDGSVRVEYQPFVHRGRDLHISEHPCVRGVPGPQRTGSARLRPRPLGRNALAALSAGGPLIESPPG